MSRLFPCIPIFRGFFVIKSVKKCVYVMLKMALVLVKNVFFWFEKSINKLGVLGNPKTYCSRMHARTHARTHTYTHTTAFRLCEVGCTNVITLPRIMGT